MIYRLDQIMILQFRKALLDNEMGDIENFEDLYTEYIDKSGMGKDGQLGLRVAIHNLDCRLNFMTGWLQIQMAVLAYKDQPHFASMKDANGYGHFVTWTGDVEDYKKQLNKIEAVEKSVKSQQKMLAKELEAMENVQIPGTVDSRNSFFTLFNVIENNYGVAIDEEKVNMLRFAGMVKMFMDKKREMEKQNNK